MHFLFYWLLVYKSIQLLGYYGQLYLQLLIWLTLECIDCVKVVTEFDYKPSIADLDKLYDDYCNETDHNVEGFIIISSLGIEKYVRLKNGTTIEPHYVGKN